MPLHPFIEVMLEKLAQMPGLSDRWICQQQYPAGSHLPGKRTDFGQRSWSKNEPLAQIRGKT